MLRHSIDILRSTIIHVGVLSTAVLGLGASQVWAQSLDVPNVFQPNTPAKASEVNQNFEFLLDLVARVELIDTTDAINSTAGLGPDRGFGNLLTVDRDVTITGFAFNMELTTDAGDLKFVIFDNAGTPVLLWAGTPQAFPLDAGAPTWKRSEDMCLVLEAGKTYKFAAMVNVNSNWPYEFVVNTSNGITVQSRNQNFTGFDNPVFTGNGSVNFWQRIYGIPNGSVSCP